MANIPQHYNNMSPPISGFEEMCLNDTSVKDSVTKVIVDNFIEGYEHPVAWFKKYNVQKDENNEDVLYANLDMKKITLEENNLNKPEHIKWKLFGYYLVICYEHASKGETDKALEIIGEVEHLLTSFGSDHLFLNSIKIALKHITFSFKCYLSKLCSPETSVLLESIVMPNEMDPVNKAALYGAEALFFNEYGSRFVQLAKDSALKAICLNAYEAEWHYLLSKVNIHEQQMVGNFRRITQQEIYAAEKAAELGKNDKYKLHLAQVYERMSRCSFICPNYETRKHYTDAGLKLVKEVLMSNTNDVLLLKNCLLHLLKLSLNEPSDDLNKMLEKLVNKLKSSNYAYVHAAIGMYYLKNKKDYKTANFYLKKAFEVKIYNDSLDYVYTFYKIDPDTSQVEPLLIEMIKSFPHPFNLVQILSHIISYLILTKNDLIQALKYIPQLLSFKQVNCVQLIQNHRMKFSNSKIPINMINMLTEQLYGALSDNILPVNYLNRVKEVIQMLELYKQHVSCLMQKNEHNFGNNNLKNGVPAMVNKPFSRNYKKNELWGYKNHRQDPTSMKNKEENWRSLKPEDSTTNPKNLFGNFYKLESNCGLQVKFRMNSQK